MIRRILTWFLWIFLIVAIGAVVYFVWTQVFAGNEDEVVGSSVKLACTEECADRAQCGTTIEAPERVVVLGGLDAPIVEPLKHDIFILVGAEVEVKDTRSETLEQVNGRQFDQTFSRVEWRDSIGGIMKTGWFANWCIENS